MSEVVKEFKSSVEKSISFYKEELKGVRTGRASVAMFENIKVDYYGTPTPLTYNFPMGRYYDTCH